MNKLKELPEIFIGTGGWGFGQSDHLFYPSKTKKDFRKLEYYSQYFDSVEINSTFYNPSFAPWHVERWLNDVSANTNFQFTVKLFQGFTHDDTAT
ncbi:MAG: DUF72 domain-containing protein, partial [Ignavibacteriae bacterium]|nr:DUF72 domain-containing protein [Ignavibacteriota bacterium]